MLYLVPGRGTAVTPRIGRGNKRRLPGPRQGPSETLGQEGVDK